VRFPYTDPPDDQQSGPIARIVFLDKLGSRDARQSQRCMRRGKIGGEAGQLAVLIAPGDACRRKQRPSAGSNATWAADNALVWTGEKRLPSSTFADWAPGRHWATHQGSRSLTLHPTARSCKSKRRPGCAHPVKLPDGLWRTEEKPAPFSLPCIGPGGTRPATERFAPAEARIVSPVVHCAGLVLVDIEREVITPTAKPPKAPARIPNSTRMGNHSTQCFCDLRRECTVPTFPPHADATPSSPESISH
jgi:hypothetical protein